MTVQYGTLDWSLPPQLKYVPNEEIPVSITVTNPDIVPHEYSLLMQVTVDVDGVKELVYQEPLEVRGAEWFTLVPGEVLITPGSLYSSVAPATLHVFIKERKTDEYFTEVLTELIRGYSFEEVGLVIIVVLLAGVAMLPLLLGEGKEQS